LYHRVFIKGTQRLANGCSSSTTSWIDRSDRGRRGKVGRGWRKSATASTSTIVDGAVNGVGAVAGWLGSALRQIQTGKAQNYLLVGLVAVSLLLGAFLLLPKCRDRTWQSPSSIFERKPVHRRGL
jgi:hypothetical protein